jgi:hypothetical protein
MKYINSYKIFERIQLGRIYLKDYYFVSDNENEGYLTIISKEDKEYKIEVKYLNETEIRIFYPESEMKVDINLLDKICLIFNKNRLGYVFNSKVVKSPGYGLKPYGIIKVNKESDISDLEKVIASTKAVNNKVKKDGDLDQFTF